MLRWTPQSPIRRSNFVATFLCALAAFDTFACTETVAPRPGRPASDEHRELAQAHATDITVTPSGDPTGVTDANAIEYALNALPAAGVIRLASGDFYVNRPIVAPIGFSGSVLGASKAATLITGVGSVQVPFPNATMTTPGDFSPIGASALFVFPRPTGDLRISDLTMTLVPGFATRPSTYGFTDLTGFVLVQLAPEGSNTSFANLRLVGVTSTGSGDPFPGVNYQPLWGIGVMGSAETFPILSSGGHHSLTSSDIDRIGIQATAYQLLKRAEVVISGNVYSDDKQAITRWIEGSNVSIERNTFDTYSFGSITITQEGLPIPGDHSTVVIRNNNITVKGYLGIEIGFSPVVGRPNFNLLIEQNSIVQAGSDPIGFFPNLAGIALFDGQDNATVRNNVLRGRAQFGIVAEGVNNSVFLGNNLRGLTATQASVALFGSNNNALVGTGQATVWDFGTGNTITGLTRASGDATLGDQIRASQQRRLELLRPVSHTPPPVGPPPDSGSVLTIPLD